MDVSKQTVGVREGNVVIASAVRTSLGAVAEVRLFQEGFAPTPNTTDAEFLAEEADFSGYAEIVVGTWDPVGVESGGPVAFFANDTSLLFQNSTGVLGNNISGAWLRKQTAAGPPATFQAVEFVIFDPPVSMQTALATINMEWRLRFPAPGEVSYSY